MRLQRVNGYWQAIDCQGFLVARDQMIINVIKAIQQHRRSK